MAELGLKLCWQHKGTAFLLNSAFIWSGFGRAWVEVMKHASDGNPCVQNDHRTKTLVFRTQRREMLPPELFMKQEVFQ